MTNQVIKDALVPERLKAGDRVRFVSPASPVSRDKVGIKTLEDLGLIVEYGAHVFDVDETFDYLAGKDEDRLADINEALQDPGIKAIIATRGGKGAYRIADGLDFEAARKNPKLLIGFSEITILHMALMKHGILGGIHGAPWSESFDKESAKSFVHAVTSTEPIAYQFIPIASRGVRWRLSYCLRCSATLWRKSCSGVICKNTSRNYILQSVRPCCLP